MSLDAEVFLNIFKEASSSSAATPLPVALPKGNVEERAPAFMRSRPGRKAAPVPLECGDLRSKMGFPCWKGLPKADNKKKKKKKVKKTLGKKPAAEGRPAASGPEARAAWAKLKLTKAKKPERAYVRGTLTTGEKSRLIVVITRGISENYLAPIRAIYN